MIVVAFPGGAGGHFLGYVVKSLLSQQLTTTAAAINFHALACPCQSFLNFSFLDPGQTSQEEELCYINDIRPQSKLVLGHFRNIDAVYQAHHCPVIAVSVSDADHELLVSRVIREAIDRNFSGIKYQDVRGEDWPETNPGYAKLPRWVQLEIQSQLHKMFYYWNAQIKNNLGTALMLTTQDIFHGSVIEKIADYVKKPPVAGLEALHEEYKQLVRNKYLKNTSSTL